jgi:hypothetical protein
LSEALQSNAQRVLPDPFIASTAAQSKRKAF